MAEMMLSPLLGLARAGLLFAVAVAAGPSVQQNVVIAPVLPFAQHWLGATPTVAAGLGIAAQRPTEKDFAAIAETGVKFVRVNLPWESTERARGVYDFATYARQASIARSHGLRMIFILDYGNALYSKAVPTARLGVHKMRAAAPNTPRAVAAYAAWARAAAVALNDYNPVWEIWNEPDNPPFWPPKPDPAAYVRLAEAACRSIRSAASDARIIGPAAANTPGAFAKSPLLTAVFASGLPRCLNAVSVHPYAMREDAEVDAALWRSFARLRPAGSSIGIVNSEWGRSVVKGTSEEDQARYLVRTLAVAIASGVPMNVWYVLRDGAGYTPKQSHFGLLRVDGKPKPAFAALRTFTNQVGGMNVSEMRIDSDVVRLRFSNGNRTVVLAWSEAGERVLPRGALPGVERAFSMTGAPIAPAAALHLSADPVYLLLAS